MSAQVIQLHPPGVGGDSYDAARRLARNPEAVVQEFDRRHGLRLVPGDELAARRAMRRARRASDQRPPTTGRPAA